MEGILRAVVRGGKVEVLDPVDLPDGMELQVAVLSADDRQFWSRVSRQWLNTIWGNPEDDVYAELLRKWRRSCRLSLLQRI